MNILNEVLGRWRRDRVRLLPPHEEKFIVAALSKTGRDISRDVISLYSAVGGMEDYEMDSHCWSLWSLDRLVSENFNYARPYILFADFLINSHLYCLRYESEESSVHIDYFNNEEPQFVANSLTEFFELYLRKPERIEVL